MIHDSHQLREWENHYIANAAADYFRNLQIFEALYQEAVALGVLPPKDRLEGIEDKIRLARMINVSTDS